MSSIFVHAYRPSWDFTEGSLFDFGSGAQRWSWHHLLSDLVSIHRRGSNSRKSREVDPFKWIVTDSAIEQKFIFLKYRLVVLPIGCAGKWKGKKEREGSCDRQADDSWTSSHSTWPWLAGSSHPTLLPWLPCGKVLPNEVKYVSRNNVIRFCSLSTIQWHFYLFILRHFLCSDR